MAAKEKLRLQANPAVSCGAASCKHWARLLQRLCRQHHLRVVPATRLSQPQCKHTISSSRHQGILRQRYVTGMHCPARSGLAFDKI